MASTDAAVDLGGTARGGGVPGDDGGAVLAAAAAAAAAGNAYGFAAADGSTDNETSAARVHPVDIRKSLTGPLGGGEWYSGWNISCVACRVMP